MPSLLVLPLVAFVSAAAGYHARLHRRAAWWGFSAAVGLASCLGACVNGKLTPGATTAIDEAIAAACPLEAMVPDIGPELVLACPTEVAAARAAVAADTVAATADAGAAPAAPASAPVLQALVVRGRRVGVRVRPAAVPAVMVRAQPLPSSVLPVVGPLSVDGGAGKDGGS